MKQPFNKIPSFLSRNLVVNHFFLDENGRFSVKTAVFLAKIQRNWMILRLKRRGLMKHYAFNLAPDFIKIDN